MAYYPDPSLWSTAKDIYQRTTGKSLLDRPLSISRLRKPRYRPGAQLRVPRPKLESQKKRTTGRALSSMAGMREFGRARGMGLPVRWGAMAFDPMEEALKRLGAGVGGFASPYPTGGRIGGEGYPLLPESETLRRIRERRTRRGGIRPLPDYIPGKPYHGAIAGAGGMGLRRLRPPRPLMW